MPKGVDKYAIRVQKELDDIEVKRGIERFESYSTERLQQALKQGLEHQSKYPAQRSNNNMVKAIETILYGKEK